MDRPIGDLLSGMRLKVALLQDYVVDMIYDGVEPDAILYGGTAVWRCYGGGRFSEDIDIYMKGGSVERLIGALPKYGLRLLWRDREVPTNIRIGRADTSILLEAKDGGGESVIMRYARVDGSSKTIGVLSPTELLIRKMEAYEGRGFIRDLYDIYVLTRHLDRRDYTVQSALSRLIKNIKPPVDEGALRSLVYAGNNMLTYIEIVDYLRRWL